MNLLICGVNWLGDGVMSMPALQAFRRRNPQVRVTMLVKEGLVPLWRLHSCVDHVLGYAPDFRGSLAAAAAVRDGAFDQVVVFPNSFRSALIPCLARVPVRVGLRGHSRAWLLTDVKPSPYGSPGRSHQAWEYMALLGMDDAQAELETPVLNVPAVAEPMAAPQVVLMPGAARGPSKQWPWENYVAVGRALARQSGCRLVVTGTAAEADLCRNVAEGIGPEAVSLAGRTSLPELVSLLASTAVVVANDSGGMHLATTVGASVVAIFGLTDPERTGPLGAGHKVFASPGVRRSRDIARSDPAAEKCLRSILPEQVADAAQGLLRDRSRIKAPRTAGVE